MTGASEELVDYLLGDMSADDRASLEQRVADDDALRDELKRLRPVVIGLTELPDEAWVRLDPPPLADMERTLFQLTGIAFAALSCGLVIGVFYIEDIRGQHLSHKIVFSLLAWLTFAVLLAGRHWRHWRGRRAVKYVIAGFVLLALGFFGSKIALELILQRA